MEAKRGQVLIQMWNEYEIDITKKTSNSYEVKADDIRRAASAAAKQPSAYLPDSQFLRALGTEDVYTTPPVHRFGGSFGNGFILKPGWS
jgi:hypothetical protein